MKFLSLFSGIEAASMAWRPLGWECVAVAEVDAAASAVLAYRHPSVPNLGDVTKITESTIAALGQIDLVVFGSPCQDLSVAGKRAGLSGARSGLFHTAVGIVRWARKHGGCRFALWENVPGAFSSHEGRDFALVVGTLAGLRNVDVPAAGWGSEGCAVGDDGLLEWSTLDAQWFGVAQRRRRVFALADFGAWADRGPILLEPQSLRGDSPPRREQGQGFTHATAPCLTSSGRGVERPGESRGQDPVVAVAYGGNNQSGPIDVATARNACASASGRMDFESETFLVQPDLYSIMPMNSGRDYKARQVDVAQPLLAGGPGQGNQGGDYVLQAHPVALRDHENVAIAFNARQDPDAWTERSGPLDTDGATQAVCVTGDVTHTLRADGFDASEDGTWRGQPIVAFDTTQVTSKTNRSNPQPGDPCHPLTAGGNAPTIAFQDRFRGDDGRGYDRPPPVSVDQTGTLETVKPWNVATSMAVRRLTPRECERLQGFPDDYTRIPVRQYAVRRITKARPADYWELVDGAWWLMMADGPRYKMLGNSMAVPCMAWIGRRIDAAVRGAE